MSIKLRREYTILWILWLLSFCVIELRALVDKRPGDTLSEHVWKVVATGVDKRTTVQWILRGGFVAFLSWLVSHFLTGWNPEWLKGIIR